MLNLSSKVEMLKVSQRLPLLEDYHMFLHDQWWRPNEELYLVISFLLDFQLFDLLFPCLWLVPSRSRGFASVAVTCGKINALNQLGSDFRQLLETKEE